MSTRKLLDLALYIHWTDEATKYNLTQEEFTNIYEKLKNNGKKVTFKTKRQAWIDKGIDAWRYDKQGDYEYIYTRTSKGYVIYSSNSVDDKKNEGQIAAPGKKIGRKKTKTSFNQDFQKMFKTTMKSAFNTVGEEFKTFIPKQFYYNFVSDRLKPKDKTFYQVEHSSSIDFCSMYPSSACGLMPDAHTRKDVDAYVKPDAEYQFAFYPDTGHMAIYNELDTHEWTADKLAPYMFRTIANMPPKKRTFLQNPYGKDTKTILMKASAVEITPLWQLYYANRKTDESMKLKMNSTIGKWHRKGYKQDKYAHLAAVVVARSNDKMMKVCRPIPMNDIIQICVDGLIYKGKFKLGGTEKALGLYEQEFTDCTVAYAGQNQYIVADKKNNIVKFKSGGYNYFNDGRPIDARTVTSLSDIKEWKRVVSKSKEREIENMEDEDDN